MSLNTIKQFSFYQVNVTRKISVTGPKLIVQGKVNEGCIKDLQVYNKQLGDQKFKQIFLVKR